MSQRRGRRCGYVSEKNKIKDKRKCLWNDSRNTSGGADRNFSAGNLIEGQERKAVGEVQAVPAQYIASDSLLAKEASESLKLNDRIQLITGQWESETQEAYSYEMTLKDYEAAALARDSMEAIYQKGQYPSDLASSYANWYTWEAFPEKAVDTTFHTYSAYYWKLIFTKYDGTEKHAVFLLEDGTVLLAEAEGKDILSDVTATEEASSSVKDNEEEKQWIKSWQNSFPTRGWT